MKKQTNSGSGATWFLLLHAALLLYSTSGLFSKNAASRPFLSTGFILFYAGMILVLGLYALLWQQIIKRLPVTFAYANKAVTVVWGVVLGALFFKEKVSGLQIAGCGVIMLGTVLYVLADRDSAKAETEGTGEDAGPGKDGL